MSRPVSIRAQVEALTSSESEWPRWRAQSGGASLSRIRRSTVAGIGDAQQRLGEAHQRHALRLESAYSWRKRVDAALAEPAPARLGDEVMGAPADALQCVRRQGGGCQDLRHRLGLVQAIG